MEWLELFLKAKAVKLRSEEIIPVIEDRYKP